MSKIPSGSHFASTHSGFSKSAYGKRRSILQAFLPLSCCLIAICFAQSTGAQSVSLTATSGNNQVTLGIGCGSELSRLSNERDYIVKPINFRPGSTNPSNTSCYNHTVERSLTSGTGYQALTTISGSMSSYTDTTTINGQGYYYRVASLIVQLPNAYTVYSNEAFATPTTSATDALLPRTFLNTNYVEPSGTEVTFDITDNPAINGERLQQNLNAVLPGQKLIVKALTPTNMPAIYQAPAGGFIVPNKNGTAPIYVMTSRYAELPAPGTRVQGCATGERCDTDKMPTLLGVTLNPVLKFANGANKWRFIGINVEIDSAVARRVSGGNRITHVIDIGVSATTLDQMPRDIVFDRSNLHSHPNCEVGRIVAMHGINIAVIDSRVYEGTALNTEAQAILSYNGPGSYKIVNNYLSGSGEIVFFGGGSPILKGIIPMDVEIRRNHFFKDLKWVRRDGGSPGEGQVRLTLKNMIESKQSARVLMEGNVFENYKTGDESQYFAVVLKDGAPIQAHVTKDWTIRYNRFKNCNGGYLIGAGSDLNIPNHSVERISINNNLWTDFAKEGERRWFLLLSSSDDSKPDLQPKNIKFSHETAVSIAGDKVGWMGEGGGTPNSTRVRGFEFKNSIVGNVSDRAFTGSGVGEGASVLDEFTPDTNPPSNNFNGNLLIGRNITLYPMAKTMVDSNPANNKGNFAPSSIDAVGFQDFAGNNLRLIPGSTYQGKGITTDGADPGANINSVESMTAGAITGIW